MDYFFVFILILCGLAMVGGGLLGSHLLAPKNPNPAKNSTYECGEKTIGSSNMNFNVAYYLYGILFLIFDVEAAFLFPWAVVFKPNADGSGGLGMVGLIEVVLFILVLVVGLVYAWRKGVLEWE